MGERRKEGRKAGIEAGQTIVEFALVVSLLFLVVFGIVEFSRLFFAYGTMSHGVREAARYAIVQTVKDPDDETEINALVDKIRAVAESRMVLIGGTASVTVDFPDFDPLDPDDEYRFCPHYCSVLVRAESTYDPWILFIPEFNMVAQSKMHFE